MSAEAKSIRAEDADHKNHRMDDASSAGSDITRVTSRERVARILSFEGRIVAMYAPSGLGRDWVDATFRIMISNDRKQ